MRTFIIRTGLTERLIRAHDERDAERRFLQMLTFSDSAVYARTFTPAPGEIDIREAAEEDEARFSRKRRPPPNQRPAAVGHLTA